MDMPRRPSRPKLDPGLTSFWFLASSGKRLSDKTGRCACWYNALRVQLSGVLVKYPAIRELIRQQSLSIPSRSEPIWGISVCRWPVIETCRWSCVCSTAAFG
ncbi:hypothetical protein VTK73DRAFT_8358 [Phialemonium thermophilum]|uniref:Uncharacterized protein n=1 Tax=Phialemonium thermophilum TaxID=223376 RepID=A0ABR3XPB6_9PEZI